MTNTYPIHVMDPHRVVETSTLASLCGVVKSMLRPNNPFDIKIGFIVSIQSIMENPVGNGEHICTRCAEHRLYGMMILGEL